MSFVPASKNSFSVKAYVGDEKTLLAFNFASQDNAKNLAGFTVFCQPPGQVPGYYLQNELRFEDPSKHKQVAAESPNSSVNAPIQKYRWTHYPGTAHQGVSPAFGNYTFTVTPRYFDSSGSMQALDSTLSVPVTVPVGPFKKGSVTLGFTRGYMQSEGYVHHFGKQTPVVPKTKQLGYYSDMYKLEFGLPKFNMYRRILARILAEDFVRPGIVNEKGALELARLLLRDNARRLFKI